MGDALRGGGLARAFPGTVGAEAATARSGCKHRLESHPPRLGDIPLAVQPHG